MARRLSNLVFIILILWYGSNLACSPALTPPRQAAGPRVVATTTFLADMAGNVAGTRASVTSLVPIGVDPHGFQATPADVRQVADATVLVKNGLGLEVGALEKLIETPEGNRTTIEATAGITPRKSPAEKGGHDHEADPHCWLDPSLAVKYIENIRDGLSQADPAGRDTYTANADAYIAQLKALDAWAVATVGQVPPERRLLVTNHESMGYFADRYGFRVVGAIIPNVSSGASPSAREMAELVELTRKSGVKAIFLETGSNPQLADQVAKEAGVKVEAGLHSHSVTEKGGSAPTYITMIEYNVNSIVNALK